MTSLFNVFSSLDDSIKLTGDTAYRNASQNGNTGNDSVRKYGEPDSLHHTSLHQGKQFKKYQEKILFKNQKNANKVSRREGFQGSFNSGSGSGSGSGSDSSQSQQVLNETAISSQEQTNDQQLTGTDLSLAKEYKASIKGLDESIKKYYERTNKKTNPYLNKVVAFTSGECCYVNNKGYIAYIPTWQTFLNAGGTQEQIDKMIYLTIPMPDNFWTEGTVINTTPPLITSTLATIMIGTGGQVGHEGQTVFVDRMLENPTPTYLGCYADNPTQSVMTFIGSAPASGAVIVNGNFSQPAIADNTYEYLDDSSTVPGWTFSWASLMNNSTAWGYATPYPVGNQAATIQATSSIGQYVNMDEGTYNLSFWACGRPNYSGSNTINVVLNSATVTSITPPVNVWTSYDVSLNVTTSGTNVIQFIGTIDNDNNSTAIQGVTLSSGSSDSSGNYTLQQCQQAAIINGYQYFGLQNVNTATGQGYCAVSNDQVSATSLGASTIATGTTSLWSSNTGNGVGSYATVTNTGALVVYNSSGTIVYTTDASGATPSNYYGCYGDAGTRAMTTMVDGGATNYTVASCMQQAQNQGMNYFGLEWVQSNGQGQCFLSNDIDQSREYGLASNCTSVSGDMYGGGWSNAVYGVSPGVDYYLTAQDDGNLVLYRGQGPNDDQGVIWATGTQNQLQDANPAYQASSGVYGVNYITVGQALYPGDFIGNTNGSGYLIMQSDGNLVYYTSQMGTNCSTLTNTLNTPSGTNATSKAASLTQMGGGQYGTALYQLPGVGIPGNMGQLGYVDNNSTLYTFPASNSSVPICAANYGTTNATNNNAGSPVASQYICPKEAPVCQNYVSDYQWGTCTNTKLLNKYTKIPGMDNEGADMWTDLSGVQMIWYGTAFGQPAATVQDCENTCNSYNDCFGFAFSNGTCYPKTNDMSYSGNNDNPAVDLYTRHKEVAGPPLGVPKVTTPISSTAWGNYYQGGVIKEGFTGWREGFREGYGLNEDPIVQSALSSLNNLDTSFNNISSQVNETIGKFSSYTGLVNKQATQNSANFNKYKRELNDTTKRINQMKEKELGNFERIKEDTDIRVLQETYGFLFWSILAIGSLLILMKIQTN
jgi:hypothetical protein